MAKRPGEIDGVELTRSADGWPAGTRGTVVLASDDEFALVEIVRERDGCTEALVEVRYADLQVVEPAS